MEALLCGICRDMSESADALRLAGFRVDELEFESMVPSSPAA